MDSQSRDSDCGIFVTNFASKKRRLTQNEICIQCHLSCMMVLYQPRDMTFVLIKILKCVAVASKNFHERRTFGKSLCCGPWCKPFIGEKLRPRRLCDYWLSTA